MKKISLICCVLMIVLLGKIMAQPSEKLVKVIVGCDKEDWSYKIGQTPKFNVMILKNGSLLKNIKIKYSIGPEKMKPTKVDSLVSSTGMAEFNGGSMSSEGFLRCIVTVNVNGLEYRNLATAAFEPEKILPIVEMPNDFNAFWTNAKDELSKIPVDAKMTLLPERCTEKVNVYHVNIQNFKKDGTTRLYGILTVPKKEGKYPALLRVPGAGVRPYYGDVKTAAKGVIVLEIGIHGISVIMEPSVYADMSAGWLNQYWQYNLDNRDMYYYKRVFLGCVRANDFIYTLPQFDGSNLAVEGGSQGGALSIVTAALDPRVKYAAPTYPAMADMVGYTANRAGGWPHTFDKNLFPHHITAEKIKTAAYYDVVNFAKQLTIPVHYSLGYNDETCPPTSMYAAYNSIKSPKELKLYLETGHWNFPEESDDTQNWVLKKLNVK